jgi:predicted SnoaL-like aldol condensation-catalyzing enzyme
MDVEVAARRWTDTWSRSWPIRDIEAIVSLYADDTVYRALAFREPDLGSEGVRDYLTREFGVEEDIECRFGEPLASGNQAAVEWWATWREHGQQLTYAGMTLLRFNEEGEVADHRDYTSYVEGRQPEPYAGWLDQG